MSQFDTRRRRPPVRLGLANARIASRGLMIDAGRLSPAAGQYGSREIRFASVPIMLRIQSRAGPHSAAALAATLPVGTTRRKRGYPGIVTLPTNQPAHAQL